MHMNALLRSVLLGVHTVGVLAGDDKCTSVVCVSVLLVLQGHKSVHTVAVWGLTFTLDTNHKSPCTT